MTRDRTHRRPRFLPGAPPSEAGLADWRRRVLVAAGFDAGLAGRLAHQPGVDLHAVLELVDRGCPPELAARIEAPLEEEPG